MNPRFILFYFLRYEMGDTSVRRGLLERSTVFPCADAARVTVCRRPPPSTREPRYTHE